MEDLVITIVGGIMAVCILHFVLFLLIYCVIYMFKCEENEKEYLKTLSKEDIYVIEQYKSNKNIKFLDTFKKKEGKNEDK